MGRECAGSASGPLVGSGNATKHRHIPDLQGATAGRNWTQYQETNWAAPLGQEEGQTQPDPPAVLAHVGRKVGEEVGETPVRV